MYERPYNKALSPGLAGPLLRRCGFARDEVVGRTMSIIQGPGTERDLMDGLMAHARRGEKGTGGLGGSLEPPGPLLTHLHTVYIAYSECLPTRKRNPLAERACFSQALSDDLISSYYVGGLYGGLYERLYNKVLSSCFSQVWTRRPWAECASWRPRRCPRRKRPRSRPASHGP